MKKSIKYSNKKNSPACWSRQRIKNKVHLYTILKATLLYHKCTLFSIYKLEKRSVIFVPFF